MGLTQAELSRQIACSTVTIKKFESGDLRPSRQLAELLAVCLQVPSNAREAFVRFARTPLGDSPVAFHLPPQVGGTLAPDPTLLRCNLPNPLTPLVGREREVAAGIQLLRRPEARLLTLIGPPGAGKTRLSIQIASALQKDFVDGVYFVELAPLTEGAEVVTALASALGVYETPGRSLLASVEAWVAHKEALIVLDNFEHLLSASASITALLNAAADLKVMATSREALHVYGEHRFSVPSLAWPDEAEWHLTETVTADYPAIALFVQRAQAVQPEFELTSFNAAAVAAICARLDGLPLAIEMAAACVRWFTPQALLAQLSQRFSLLADGPRDVSPRHQTLRGAIDWSYNLLNARERQAFQQFAVFAGGSSVEALLAVLQLRAPESGNLPPDLASLVNKNLVCYAVSDDAASGPRLWMLETVREYALDKLENSPEAQAVCRRHAAYYVALAEAADPALNQAQQSLWLRRLETEHGNLRAALRWCLAHAPEMGLRLAAALQHFWLLHGYLTEGRTWLESLLQRGESAGVDVSVRARALSVAGRLTDYLGEYQRADRLSAEGLAIFRGLSDKRGLATALYNLAGVRLTQNDYERSEHLLNEALQLYQELGDSLGMANVLDFLGQAAKEQGDFESAVAYHEQSLDLHRTVGNPRGVGRALTHLSIIAYWKGDYARADVLAGQGLAAHQELGAKGGMALALECMGMAAYKLGDPARGMQLLTNSLALCRQIGDKSGEALLLHDLGIVALTQGDAEQARYLYGEGLSLACKLGDKRRAAFCLEGMGMTLADAEPERATQLFSAAHVLRRTTHAPLPPSEIADYEAAVAQLRTRLGEAKFSAAWASGQTLTPEQVAVLMNCS